MKLEKGYVQVYTGDGKGKTTAALGLALRASGHGLKTVIIQFMKGRTDYGELHAVKKIPEITIHQFGRVDFVKKGEETEADFKEARRAVEFAKKTLADPEISIVVLDEINVALFFELIKTEDVIELIDQKPIDKELILTGRRVPDEIIERADLVTRMEEIKHYYSTINLQARMGIEY